MTTRAELEQNKIKQNKTLEIIMLCRVVRAKLEVAAPAQQLQQEQRKPRSELGSRCHAAPRLLLAALTAG
jgi:hypothetical protein